MEQGNSKKVIIIIVITAIVLCLCTACCIISSAWAYSRYREANPEQQDDQNEETPNENPDGDGDGGEEPTNEPDLNPVIPDDKIDDFTDEFEQMFQGDFESAKVSVDDDPILGSEDAKVVIVEFGDYECPFCQRHFEEVHPLIIEKYVETDKVAIVFRDFPLAFHNPAATREALAAECVDDLSDDETYFDFHNLIFKNTEGNGAGLSADELKGYAEDLGVNGSAFATCLSSEKFLDEVENDIADGTEAEVSGTPAFIVGYMKSDGTVSGVRIDGAYPYETFENVIDTLLTAASK